MHVGQNLRVCMCFSSYLKETILYSVNKYIFFSVLSIYIFVNIFSRAVSIKIYFVKRQISNSVVTSSVLNICLISSAGALTYVGDIVLWGNVQQFNCPIILWNVVQILATR